ncbi:hypothetical protein PTTG_28506, partial [Puccinia triticina 1-1 BBBD Race 1]
MVSFAHLITLLFVLVAISRADEIKAGPKSKKSTRNSSGVVVDSASTTDGGWAAATTYTTPFPGSTTATSTSSADRATDTRFSPTVSHCPAASLPKPLMLLKVSADVPSTLMPNNFSAETLDNQLLVPPM